MDSKPQPFKRLSGPHLKLFVAVLLQNEIVFQNFYGKLTVEHFSDEHYRLLYRMLLDFWGENSTLPTEAETYAGIMSYYETDPEIISELAQDELEDFLNYAYDPVSFGASGPDSAKMEKFGFKAGKRLLQEQLVQSIAAQVTELPDLDQLSKFFQTAATQSDYLALHEHSNKPKLSFGENFDKIAPFMVQSTGLDFLDKYMAGGSAPREVYGLMAPYGTCKTTIAVMLWCLAARQAYEETLRDEWDGKKGLSFIVTYEAPLAPEIQHRALMYAATIHRSSLEKMGYDGLDALRTDPNEPLPYEQKKFINEISEGLFQPERTRVDAIIPILNNHTVCLDFTGADPDFPTAGSGGIGEIESRIKLELRNRGLDKHYVKNVIVDYLGLMVDRDQTLDGPKRADNHLLYQQAIPQLQKNISTAFNCHTWVMHQLSGQANAMLSPTKTLHHTDAKGSKSFGENLNFAFVIGNLNLDQMGQIACTKHRRSKNMPPSIIKVQGEYNNVVAPDNYHIDGNGKIVDKSTADAVGAEVVDLFDDLIDIDQNMVASATGESDYSDEEGDDG